MSLVADTLEQARTAYAALEGRAESAEHLAQALKAALADARLRATAATATDPQLRGILGDLLSANASMREHLRAAIMAKADMPLQRIIESIALAAALGEATMPDRIVSSLTATLRSYLTLEGTTVGVSFFQPGVGTDPSSLTGTSLELSKLAPATPMAPAPRLYTVWEDKQGIYSQPTWGRFQSAGVSGGALAADLVVAISLVLQSTGGWSFGYLVAAGQTIGAKERALAALVAATQPGAQGAEFVASTDDLLSLVVRLAANTAPVVGDLLALTSAIDRVTRAGRELLL